MSGHVRAEYAEVMARFFYKEESKAGRQSTERKIAHSMWLIPLLLVMGTFSVFTSNPLRAETLITVYFQATTDGVDPYGENVSTTATGSFTYDADVDIGDGFHPLRSFTFDPAPETGIYYPLTCDPIEDCLDSEYEPASGSYRPESSVSPIITYENLILYVVDFDYLVFTWNPTTGDGALGYS